MTTSKENQVENGSPQNFTNLSEKGTPVSVEKKPMTDYLTDYDYCKKCIYYPINPECMYCEHVV